VALVCFANLLLEVVLTRIFSAVMFYHFTFLAISLALFGLGASGVYVYLRPTRFTADRVHADLSRNARYFSITTVAALLYVLKRPIVIITAGQTPVLGVRTLLAMLVLNGVTALPFFFAGMVVTLAITHYRRHIHRVYAFDLAGAATAALVAGVSLGLLGGPSLVLAIALLAAAAGALFDRPRAVTLAPLIGCALLLVTNVSLHLIELPSGKGVDASKVVYEKWNSFSRVTVEATGANAWDIKIDASAATSIATPATGTAWPRDVSALAYALFPQGAASALIIGPGGGRDVANALSSGVQRVTAVEVNPIIATDIMRGRFDGASQHLYDDPRVDLVVDEGRSFVRRSQDRYDVIQASLVDTWAATAAGAFALTENTLYTLEAFEDYYAHLQDDGVLTMTRWYSGDGEAARLVLLAAAALERGGVPSSEVRKHLFLATNGDLGTLVAKRLPFSREELDRLGQMTEANGFRVVLSPETDGSSTLEQLTDAGSWSPLVQSQARDLSPPTDDRPFFFYTAKPGQLFDVASLFGGTDAVTDPAVWILLSFGLTIVTLAVGFIVLPLLVRIARPAPATSDRSLRALGLGYFALLGAAFITVEVALLQKLTFFLGHPSYALLVVLFSLLLGTSGGAHLSGRVAERLAARLAEDRVARRAARTAAVLCAALVVVAFASGPILRAWVGWPLLARVMVAGVLVGGSGLLMGVLMPSGIRLLSDRDPEVVPWGWGLNGAMSVIGTVGATMLAIQDGFTSTLLIGAALYGCAAVVMHLLARRTARAVVEPLASVPASAV
jgi:hypothetical protein